MRPASFVAGAVTAVALLASLPAAADPAPGSPAAPPPGAPLARTDAPVTPPFLERRSPSAFTGGTAAVTIGGILLLSSALAGGLQAACDAHCDHTPVIVGMLAAGVGLVGAGIPLILWGGKWVPVAAPTPAMALVPRRPLPEWAGAPGSQGWAFRF